MLIGRYEITGDKWQWIVKERFTGKDKDGNDKLSIRKEAFHATAKQALNDLFDRGLQEEDFDVMDTANDFIARIELAEALISDVAKQLTKENVNG